MKRQALVFIVLLFIAMIVSLSAHGQPDTPNGNNGKGKGSGNQAPISDVVPYLLGGGLALGITATYYKQLKRE